MNITSRTSSDLRNDQYAPVLTARGFHPCGHYRELSEEQLLRYRLRQLSDDARYWVAQESDRHLVVGIRDTTWDTEQLGFSTARVELFSYRGVGGEGQPDSDTLHQLAMGTLEEVISDCSKRGIRYLVARIPSHALPAIHAFQEHGFLLLDGLINLHCNLESSVSEVPELPEVRFRAGQESDSDHCARIAMGSFWLDRFHVDPVIAPERANRLHRVWIENSFRKVAADGVWVAEYRGKAEAFVTGSIDELSREVFPDAIGHIGLVAAGQAVRGRGVATGLCLYALGEFHRMGVGHVEVGTQTGNFVAQRIYLTSGFRPVSSFFTFRRWIAP